jgi:hypothetical protein
MRAAQNEQLSMCFSMKQTAMVVVI